MAFLVDNKIPCCLLNTRFIIKRRVKREKKATDESAARTKRQQLLADKGPPAKTSQVFYDQRSHLFTSFRPNENEFWSFVDSSIWTTTIRLGDGRLQNRFIFTLQELAKKGVITQLTTAQTYRKCDLGGPLGDKWVPDRGIASDSFKCNNNNRYNSKTKEQNIRVSRTYFALNKPKMQQQEADRVAYRTTSWQRVPSDDVRDSFKVYSDEKFDAAVCNSLQHFTIVFESISDSNTWSSSSYLTLQRKNR